MYARAVLRAQPVRADHGVGAATHRGRPAVYGPAEQSLAAYCWEVTDGICSKRLAPFLGELIARLAAAEELPPSATPAVQARVAAMSARTLDRLLRVERGRGRVHGRGTTKPGTLLVMAQYGSFEAPGGPGSGSRG